MLEKTNKTIIVSVLAIISLSITLPVCLSYATSCTCMDICDIDNAAMGARAAQWEYQMQIDLLKDAENRSGDSPLWYFPGRYNDIRPFVQKRINDFTAQCDPSLNRAAGVTDGGNCQITVEPTTACMTEFVMAHETVHQTACQSFSHILSYQMSGSLVDSLAEEIRGYQTTVDMQKTLRQGPLKDCCCKNSCTPTGPGTPAGVVAMLTRIVKNLLR